MKSDAHRETRHTQNMSLLAGENETCNKSQQRKRCPSGPALRKPATLGRQVVKVCHEVFDDR